MPNQIIVAIFAVMLAACSTDAEPPADADESIRKAPEEASTVMMRTGAPAAGMDAGSTADGPTSTPTGAPDARPADLGKDQLPGDGPVYISEAGAACPEGQGCALKDSQGIWNIGGTCRAGACCAGCWDGKSCRTDLTPDSCGKSGGICTSCGWVTPSSAGFCRPGETAQWRARCTGGGTCSTLPDDSQGPRCCTGDGCRTP